MTFTDKDVMDVLKREWETVIGITDKHPDSCEYFVKEFAAMARFAEKLTGKRYTATEDGVIEY